ncbi:MAG: N-acetylmuramoyl-L-alanine amidase [Cyclobacteriaceae bacterium]
MRSLSLLFLLSFTIHFVYSQELSKESGNEYITRYSNKNGTMTSSFRVNATKPISSLSVRFEGSLKNTVVVADGKKHDLYPDEHGDGDISESALLIFEKPVLQVEIISGKELTTLHNVTAIHSPQISEVSARTQDATECEQPELIMQSSWRSGLPAPTGSRSSAATGNIIVHHAASSNDLTDYTNVVRNIYLFHTQDRGWSDIGYNYLIAQNGDIYAGRDPQTRKQDEVIGAHFCGRNSGTMGICLLGNLSLVPPTTEAISSLEDLLTWKVFTDEMDPLGTNSHPLDSDLPVIAGHRDGCATQCPGNLAYPLLPGIRSDVDVRVEECLQPPVEEERERVFAFGPNPTVTDILTISLPENVIPEDVKFVDMNGKLFSPRLTEYDDYSMKLSFNGIPKGVYIMKIDTEDFSATEKIIKL